MAKAFGVRVEDILADNASKRAPKSKLQRTFEKVSALPRRHQDLVVRFVDTLVDQHKRAS